MATTPDDNPVDMDDARQVTQKSNSETLDATTNEDEPQVQTQTQSLTNGQSLDDMEPVERLEKYSSSDIIFHRQVASRSILETLHATNNEHDLQRVADVVSRFVNDSEPSIRAELAEQLPQIACFCLNPSNRVPPSMSNITLPILEQFLSDSNSQVRKISQNSLCFMLEQSIIDIAFIEEKISPILVHLMDISNIDDFRIEAVTTVSKIARFVGKEVTEKIFLEHFSRLCSDVSFHVRRVCASNLGQMCTVVGQNLTEAILLPQFLNLCQDAIWGVRKACAEVFVPISCICSKQTRKEVLGPMFVTLLCDQSKWVKTAAFQALGPFISTFADPRKTGLYYNGSGVIVMGSNPDLVNGDPGDDVPSDENVNNCKTDKMEIKDQAHEDGPITITKIAERPKLPQISVNSSVSGDFAKMEAKIIAKRAKKLSNQKVNICENGIGFEDGHGDEDASSFNTFQFWRLPIPDLEPIVESVPIIQLENENVLGKKTGALVNGSTTLMQELSSHSNDVIMNGNAQENDDERYSSWLTPGMPSIPQQQRRVAPKQDTVPHELLEQYLNMTNSANFESVDHELSHHCAFSLPAVAMTLGRKYWPCLRETFDSLTVDMQWRVRWTLASSLHQMALILGPEYTSSDLLPAFLSFMKDLDEVRFGVLQNLSSILKLLNRPEQLGILPKIKDFMKMDNPRNWRFRSTLAQQVNCIVHLYSPLDIKEYLLPVAFALLKDKVSEVRIDSIKLLSTIMRHFYCDTVTPLTMSSLVPPPDPSSAEASRVNLECLLISELTSLVGSAKWVYRQAFVFLSEQMVTDRSLPSHIFNDHFLPPLLSLQSDPVPNVRMALTRCLVRSVCGNTDMFDGQQEQIMIVVKKLSTDSDSDVRRFANVVLKENGDEQMVIDLDLD